jgi:glycosyltransferase involved in cell wall biosynthesis
MLPDCDSLQDEIQRRFGARVARFARFSMVRGVLGWWIAREYDFVVTVNHWPGGRWLIFLTAWLGGTRRCKIILLEFISSPERRLKQLAYSIWLPLVFRPAIRRTMVAAQVMAASEPEYYSKMFSVPAPLFHFIPLPLIDDKVQDRSYDSLDDVVFASGRAACDWETLFRAAEGATWDLRVICSKQDRERVDRLNRNGRVSVRSEVSTLEHARMMANAAVYVLALRQRPISCGQIRMRNAISAGTPIVCSRVDALSSYAIHNQTASIVDVGDYAVLRREVDKLLSDPEWRRTLAARARDFARTRTASCFAGAINEFVNRVATNAFAEATSHLTSAQNTITYGPGN